MGSSLLRPVLAVDVALFNRDCLKEPVPPGIRSSEPHLFLRARCLITHNFPLGDVDYWERLLGHALQPWGMSGEPCHKRPIRRWTSADLRSPLHRTARSSQSGLATDCQLARAA
jgi:hypothetical protein